MATRPRGVRAIRPSRTRNGSATTSTVSASSPTATASVDSPTGPPPNRLTSARSTARSSRSRPVVVHLVQFQRGPGHLPGDHPVGADLGVVADPAQQPVGDPRRAPGPAGDLVRAVVAQRHAEQVGRPADDHLQLRRLVEVQVGGEPEPVPQRRGQQPGPGGRADQGERRDLQRDRGRARSLADHHVDPEVLHGQVEHLLGGPGHAGGSRR